MARRTKAEVAADNALIESIIKTLNENDVAVCKAIVLIGNDQTAEEKEAHAALQHNGKGFSMVDANYGTFLRDVILREGKLRGKLLADGRRIALKYARTQLFDRAKKKRDRHG
ncbi:hypothetical protein D3C80_829580 [compost metagenome]|jgi:hypothetical protein